MAESYTVFNDTIKTMNHRLEDFLVQEQCIRAKEAEALERRIQRQLAEQKAALIEKDNIIAENAATISAKEAALADRDAAISAKDAELAAKDAEISAQNNLIAELKAKLERVNKSEMQ